ncbi:MAG: GAF domain-containing protein [Anaerolineales bacterium]|nr:GAF domain-containing protein [Anaerolineales bacterium]
MGKTEQILLAIDDPSTRQFFERALRSKQYDLLVVDSQAALEKNLREYFPELILVGQTFAGRNGIEIAGASIERFPTLPVVLYSEHPTLELTQAALQIGIGGILQSPLNMDDTVTIVEACLMRAKHMGDWVRNEIQRSTMSLERRVKELETLVNLGRDITGTLDLDQVLKNVVEAAVGLTHSDGGSLLMVDNDSNELYMRSGYNFEDGFVKEFRLPVSDTLAGQVFRTGKSILLNESTQVKIKTSYLVHSLIYVPMQLGERIIGVLGVDNREKDRPFNDHDTLLMTVLAEYAAIAIENARLYSESESERKKFETTFSNIEDGVLILDENDRILFANDAVYSIFEEEGNFENRPVLDVITHPDIRTLLDRTGEKALRYHEVNFEDGRVFNAQFTPIPNVGAVITIQDITYLKELDHIKNDFVYTISHDLRSPLTSVLGYTDLLSRVGDLNAQQQDFVEHIQESIRHITALVNDLLDLERIEAGFDTRREVVRLDGISQYILDNLQPAIQQKNLQVNVDIEKKLSPLRGNPIRLKQMLDNLLTNAIKYSHEGGKITVSIKQEDRQLILIISDSGPGIPLEEQSLVFDKFYRASNIPGDTPGSGLGLAIVKSIVDSHQGRVWVESKEGQGSTFFVVLPAHETVTQKQRKTDLAKK